MDTNKKEIAQKAYDVCKYIWHDYCRQCIEDSGTQEDEGFDYIECKGNQCPMWIATEVLRDIMGDDWRE